MGASWRPICGGPGRRTQAGGHLLYHEGGLRVRIIFFAVLSYCPVQSGIQAQCSFAQFVAAVQGGAGKNELQELDTLRERPFNHIYWSPMGNICLLAAMGDDVGPHNGRLEVCINSYASFPRVAFFCKKTMLQPRTTSRLMSVPCTRLAHDLRGRCHANNSRTNSRP